MKSLLIHQRPVSFFPCSVSEIPSLPYDRIIRALQRDGWTVVRQKGSHIRLQKRIDIELLKLTVPAHRTVKRSTLSHILKQARLDLHHFLKITLDSMLINRY